MKEFILTRFYDLPEEADIMEAFTQFEKEQMRADMESFAHENGLDYDAISELFANYVFSGRVSDEKIRQRLSAYKLGFLKMTKLVGEVHSFIEDMGKKYKAEGK